MDKIMVLKPRMSEKAYALSQALNTYVFDVPKTANKLTVAKAITAQFKVTVHDVKIINAKGKPKKSYQKRNRPIDGLRVDVKKAYVRLIPGDSIDIFNDTDTKSDDKKRSADAPKKETK